MQHSVRARVACHRTVCAQFGINTGPSSFDQFVRFAAPLGTHTVRDRSDVTCVRVVSL
jgi:hypothetical protein